MNVSTLPTQTPRLEGVGADVLDMAPQQIADLAAVLLAYAFSTGARITIPAQNVRPGDLILHRSRWRRVHYVGIDRCTCRPMDRPDCPITPAAVVIAFDVDFAEEVRMPRNEPVPVRREVAQ